MLRRAPTLPRKHQFPRSRLPLRQACGLLDNTLSASRQAVRPYAPGARPERPCGEAPASQPLSGWVTRKRTSKEDCDGKSSQHRPAPDPIPCSSSFRSGSGSSRSWPTSSVPRAGRRPGPTWLSTRSRGPDRCLAAAVPGLIDVLSLHGARVRRIATMHLVLNLAVVAQPLAPFDTLSGGDAPDRPLGHRPRPPRHLRLARRRDGLRPRGCGRHRAGDRHHHGSAGPAAECLKRACPRARSDHAPSVAAVARP